MPFNIKFNHKLMYNAMVFIFYALTGMIFLGLSIVSASKYTKYAETLNYYIRVYTSLYILYRFNPFKKNIACTTFDKQIIFSAGLVILTTSVIDAAITETAITDITQYLTF
jgi:hypothetical protein